jgi:hypothetical protein
MNHMYPFYLFTLRRYLYLKWEYTVTRSLAYRFKIGLKIGGEQNM